MEIIDLLSTAYTLYGVGGVIAVCAGVLIYRRLPDPWKEKIRAVWPKMVERIRTR